jgi:hypothetical protein
MNATVFGGESHVGCARFGLTGHLLPGELSVTNRTAGTLQCSPHSLLLAFSSCEFMQSQ